MGGHALGEVASRLAADAAADYLLQQAAARPTGPDALARQLAAVREAVHAANRRVYDENAAQGFREGTGMGTTIVGAWLLEPPDHLGIFHVGDSRLYCWRDGSLTQLTRDHTLYQEWLDHGAEGQAPRRNIILRALGPWAELEVDVGLQRVYSGDIYLACSDGLSGLVDGAAIAAVLADADADGDLDGACRRLIDMANQAGGDDNITVVLARCR
jgi:serine/threonine protein phosphatase PrpC